MIEVSHISKSFNGKKALDNVSLAIGKCESVCIIGSMGSGKSTFTKALHKITGIPLFHLDMMFWNADKTIVEKSVLSDL